MAARSDGARVRGKVMPIWYVAGLRLVVAWAVLSWGEPFATSALVAAILLT